MRASLTKSLSFFLMLFALFLLPSISHALMSIEEERELGEKLLVQVKRQVRLLAEPELTEFVAGLGKEILDQVDVKFFDYRFFVIQDEALNAFAMPGGLIFVHSGLIEAVDSENELICVLAHEIGHVQGRHIARRMERMQRVNMATAVMAIAGLFLGRGDASSAVLATSGALNASMALKYSREDEEEADRRAYQWLCKSGYDPRGLVSVFHKMQRYRWLGTDAIPSYLSTHPGSSERITYLEDLWQSSPCRLKSHKSSFDLKRIQVKTNVLTKDPETLILRYRRELAATPGDIYLLYGLACSLLAARKYEEAIGNFKRLVASAPDTPGFRADLGKAFFTAGRYREASAVLKPYVRRYPTDLSARFYLARAYLEEAKAGEALPLFRSLKKSWPETSEIHFQMGRALAALNREGEAHYHFYRYYQAAGNSQSARFHKEKALLLLSPESDLYKKLKGEGKDEKRSQSKRKGRH